jgi:uncharacterized membrane protein
LQHIGEISALASAIFFTMTGVFFEEAGKRVGSLAVNIIRLVIGFIMLSIFTFFYRGYLLPIDATLHNWTWLGISGVIGFFLADLYLFQAYVEIGNIITGAIDFMVDEIAAVVYCNDINCTDTPKNGPNNEPRVI